MEELMNLGDLLKKKGASVETVKAKILSILLL